MGIKTRIKNTYVLSFSHLYAYDGVDCIGVGNMEIHRLHNNGVDCIGGGKYRDLPSP